MLEGVIEKLRKELEENNQQLEKGKRIIPMGKIGNNFHKGEASLHAGNNVKVESEKPTQNHEIHEPCKQQQYRKPKGALTYIRPFAPKVGGSSFQRRSQNSFSPLMYEIECFN